jgi:WD40 repeat protein
MQLLDSIFLSSSPYTIVFLHAFWMMALLLVGSGGLLTWLGTRAQVRQQKNDGGCTLRNTLSTGTSTILHLGWSPQEQMLTFSTAGKGVWSWDAVTGRLKQIYSGNPIKELAWSPDGRMLAFPGNEPNRYIFLWCAQSGEWQTIATGDQPVHSLAWSPDARLLASLTQDGQILIWDIETKTLHRSLALVNNACTMTCLAWSPDGSRLASCSDLRIYIWDIDAGHMQRDIYTAHSKPIRCLIWLANGSTLASGSEDMTIRFWDNELRLIRILEGYTAPVTMLSCAANGRLLISSTNGPHHASAIVWRTDTWERVTDLNDLAPGVGAVGHMALPLLATLGKLGNEICIWDLCADILLSSASFYETVHFTSARIVLVGNSSTPGLGLVERSVRSGEEALNKYLWILSSKEVENREKRKIHREVLLWDLSGLPTAQLMHRLKHQSVMVAVVVFDASGASASLEGARRQVLALRALLDTQQIGSAEPKIFLVAEHSRRGQSSFSYERMQEVAQELGCAGCFEINPRDGRQLAELRRALHSSIAWDDLPVVCSSRLLRDLRTYLIDEKRARRLLSRSDLVFDLLQRTYKHKEDEDLHALFDVALERLEAEGLLGRLHGGNLVLFQPEILDIYAAALCNTVRSLSDGSGSIAEESVLSGGVMLPSGKRLRDATQEHLLLCALVEDLLRREFIFREEPTLVFPSQAIREPVDLPEVKRKRLIFSFEGSVPDIYASLAVRLAQCGLFKKENIWKNAISYSASMGGHCGLVVRQIAEGRGELILFFEKEAGRRTRYHFEEFVAAHLKRHALPGSVQRRHVCICQDCETIIPMHIVQLRLECGYNWLDCPVCEKKVPLLEQASGAESPLPSRIREMDRRADERSRREVACLRLRGKSIISDYDVFLCHCQVDKVAVIRVGELLKERGILPWLDEWEQQPGRPWLDLLKEKIESIKAAAVFIGRESREPWQQPEIEEILHIFRQRGRPVIPILLPDALEVPALPPFLQGATWVDFRPQAASQSPGALERLVESISHK